MNQSLERFVHGGMLVLSQGTPAREAARAMHERRVGSAVVCNNEGQMVGLVTDRDLSSQVLAFDYSPDTSIREFMTSDIYKLTEDQTVTDAIRLMEEYGIRRIPVVRRLGSGKEKCVGMITLDDLIVEKSVDLQTLSRIVSQQVLKPTRKASVRKTKRDARLENTLERFYSLMGKEIKLNHSDLEEVVFYLLSTIVRRLPATGAAQMISQLPALLQEDLLDLRVGPDREITANTLLSEMVARFDMPLKKASETLEGFWDALEEFTDRSGETNQVLMQLPVEMRALLN